jgi:hypothetical protein
MRLALILAMLPFAAHAGTAPEADLSAPIPLCQDIDAALALTPASFEGLHPDAFAQFRQMLDDLCADPVAAWRDKGLDDADLLAAVFNGQRVPAPVPLPPSLLLLTAAIAALALKGKRNV